MSIQLSDYQLVEESFSTLIKNITIKTRIEIINVLHSCGRVLAKDIISFQNIPNYNASHMDGFAIKSNATSNATSKKPLILNITDEKTVLGKYSKYLLKKNQASKIQTGGYLPINADAVIPIEMVKEISKHTIKIDRPVKKGAFVFLAGSDIKKGEKVLPAGKLIKPQDMAFLASLNFYKISVIRKPIISIIPTGNELTDNIEENSRIKKKGNKKIINSNGPMITYLIEQLGGSVLNLGVTPDNTDLIKKKIKFAIKKSDIILTIGGSSVGEQDKVKSTINSLGNPGVLAYRVKLDRGRVSGIAAINNKPIIILPGPVQGALNAFFIFVIPLIKLFQEIHNSGTNITVSATITEDWNARDKFKDFKKILYVRISKSLKGFLAHPITGHTESISLLIKSNGFVIIPESIKRIKVGQKVEVNMLPGFSYEYNSIT